MRQAPRQRPSTSRRRLPFFRKLRARAADARTETARAWEDAARELEQLRASTAAELERLRASAAQARTKTAWDKAAVVIQAIAALAIIVPLIALYESVHQFNMQQMANAKQMLDQQREATLNNYLDDMSVLVLQDNLPTSKPGDPARAIAKARTLTDVRNLDGNRKAILIRYLWEAGLLIGPHPIVKINAADLNWSVFNNAILDRIALFQLGLNYAQFTGARLIDADLSGSGLYESNLTGAKLNDADLSQSGPIGAYLVDTNLSGANLTGADLTGADLTGADLTGAHLKGAKYNSKPEYVKDPQGEFVIKGPTRWSRGFDPQAAGAICYDC